MKAFMYALPSYLLSDRPRQYSYTLILVAISVSFWMVEHRAGSFSNCL